MNKKKLVSDRRSPNKNCKTEQNNNDMSSEMKIMENSCSDVQDYLMSATKEIEPKQLVYSRQEQPTTFNITYQEMDDTLRNVIGSVNNGDSMSNINLD